MNPSDREEYNAMGQLKSLEAEAAFIREKLEAGSPDSETSGQSLDSEDLASVAHRLTNEFKVYREIVGRERDELKAKNKELDNQFSDLQRELQRLTLKNESLKKLKELKFGHSDANLAAILDAAPSAEMIGGRVLRFGTVKEGQKYYDPKTKSVLILSSGKRWQHFIVEEPYIKDSEITDEMAIGRIPCQVGWADGTWLDGTLLGVKEQGSSDQFITLEHKDAPYCRIKS